MSGLEVLDGSGLEAKYTLWHDTVRNLHVTFRDARNQEIHWTPLEKPISQCRVALLSTGGVHLRSDPPFDMRSPEGDASYRSIPGDAPSGALSITHDHYNHADADRDVNCMFPIDRLRELEASGEIGAVSPLHFGFMGFIPDPARLLSESVHPVAHELVGAGVDLALLTPG